MTLLQSITDAMDIALTKVPNVQLVVTTVLGMYINTVNDDIWRYIVYMYNLHTLPLLKV